MKRYRLFVLWVTPYFPFVDFNTLAETRPAIAPQSTFMISNTLSTAVCNHGLLNVEILLLKYRRANKKNIISKINPNKNIHAREIDIRFFSKMRIVLIILVYLTTTISIAKPAYAEFSAKEIATMCGGVSSKSFSAQGGAIAYDNDGIRIVGADGDVRIENSGGVLLAKIKKYTADSYVECLVKMRSLDLESLVKINRPPSKITNCKIEGHPQARFEKIPNGKDSLRPPKGAVRTKKSTIPELVASGQIEKALRNSKFGYDMKRDTAGVYSQITQLAGDIYARVLKDHGYKLEHGGELQRLRNIYGAAIGDFGCYEIIRGGGKIPWL